jgi:hypothetical protein
VAASGEDEYPGAGQLIADVSGGACIPRSRGGPTNGLYRGTNGRIAPGMSGRPLPLLIVPGRRSGGLDRVPVA